MCRTNSRLMDSQEQDQRSGAVLKDSEVEEEDPSSDEDLPEEYKKVKFRTLTVLQLRAFGLELWKWEAIIMVLICGRLVSGWGIRLVVFFIERNFLLRKRALYFVYGLRNSVQNCIWLSLVLIAWLCIFDKKVDKMTGGKVLPYVSSIWICLLVGAYTWLLKTLDVKVLAVSFHVSTFFDRIQESLFNQYVIETLSGPPLVEIDQREHEEEEKVMSEVLADLKASTPHKTPTASTLWMNMVRKGVLSTLDEKLPQPNYEDKSAVQITSEKKAKAAAKKIFNSVAKPGSNLSEFPDSSGSINLQELGQNDIRSNHILFVMHPFDVGDRVEIDGVQARNSSISLCMMIVEEKNILTTVFLRYDNQKIICPNSVLSTKPISNYYRSPHMGDSVDFCILISTPMEKISMMKERITRYIENRSDHWYPAPIDTIKIRKHKKRTKQTTSYPNPRALWEI
ncbi:putative lysine histidine transporter-like 8-like [Capsicum annuum]|nr:putative lysine histidine transporter-like 8-like [Capsicum annuum]